MRLRSLYWVVCCIFLSLLLVSCMSNPLSGQKGLVLTAIDLNQEIALGSKAAQWLIQEAGGDFGDEVLAAYVTDLGQRLVAVSSCDGVPFRFVVVNDSGRDSQAVPGGMVLINRGLLLALDSPQPLAVILSHEMAHIIHRHALDEALRRKVLRGHLPLFSLLGPTDDAESVVTQGQHLAEFLTAFNYTEQQEVEADALAAVMLRDAGFDPQALAAVGGCRKFNLTAELGTGPSATQQGAFNEALQSLRTLAAGYEVFEQARQQERQDRLPQAIALYLQAATQAPEQSLLLTGLGLAYVKVGDFNSAKHYLRQAVNLNGHYYRSRLGLGYIHLQQNNLEQAMLQLQRSHDLLPTLQSSYLLAEGYQARQQLAQARALYQQVADADGRGKLGRAARRQLEQLPAD
ncbi:MAG: M48 family metalloprotease [Desulfuromonas sp.]|nr:M48 family metalloprotease [Desulfuromonas sp.]